MLTERAMHPPCRTARALGLLMLVLWSPAAAQQVVPTPESVLGFRPGDDFKLATYEESIEYFKRLDAASDHVQLMDVGRTSEGRSWYLAVISSPANLANLERHRESARRLAYASGLTDDDARRLAAATPAFVDISGGLLASEAAGAQHTIQLAHDLVAGDARTRALLDSVVVLLWPSLNPDGQDIVVRWYRDNVGGPYEGAPLHELYQKYIGHDNNRDGYMLNVTESRGVTRAWRRFEPQIIYVHHHSSPFPTRIWLSPFAEPIAPRSPALIVRGVNDNGPHIRDALLLHDRRFPAGDAGFPRREPVRESVERRLVAAAGRGGLHADGVAGGARLRRPRPGGPAVPSLSGGAG